MCCCLFFSEDDFSGLSIFRGVNDFNVGRYLLNILRRVDGLCGINSEKRHANPSEIAYWVWTNVRIERGTRGVVLIRYNVLSYEP